jgi:uncharacterized protein (DUF2062 family)
MRLDSIKRHLPSREQVLGNKYLRIFGEHLRDANLWHFNRRSVARATGIGLFCAYLPMPMEMIPAAFGAVLLRANLPLSLAWVWISNPVTWIPLYGPAYLLGTWLINEPAIPMDHLTLAVLRQQLLALWIGCLLVGALLGLAGFLTVHGLWRFRVTALRRSRRGRTGDADQKRV